MGHCGQVRGEYNTDDSGQWSTAAHVLHGQSAGDECCRFKRTQRSLSPSANVASRLSQVLLFSLLFIQTDNPLYQCIEVHFNFKILDTLLAPCLWTITLRP